MNIRVADIVIGLNMLHIEEFEAMDKFSTNLDYEYVINSYNSEYEIPNKDVKLKTQFYDLYEKDNKIIQVQYDNGAVIGVIEYDDKVINLYLHRNLFGVEYLLSQYALVYILKKSKSHTIFMHGSSLIYKQKGIIFSARSGTGKSTHARLWRKLSDAVSINDDKNIIMLKDDELYLYSSPWSGKEKINNNIVSSLDAIVFLYQNKDNVVKKISKIEAMKLLLPQIEKPSKDRIEIWNDMVDRLLEKPAYLYGCNMEDEAFEIIKERLVCDLCL